MIEPDIDETGKPIVLGTGSYGVVHKAIVKATGQCVAVKKPSKPEYIADVMNELLIMKAIGPHPYIVELLFTENECASIVMPLAVHGTLADVAWPSNPLVTADEAANVLRQICTALAFMHDTFSIAHCDVSIHNVLVIQCAPIHVNLCDFGSAGKCDAVTGRLLISENDCNTDIIYCRTRSSNASPECFACQVVDNTDPQPNSFKCDVWAAGITVMDLVTGKKQRDTMWFDVDHAPYKQWQKKTDAEKVASLHFLDNLRLQELLALRIFRHSETDRASAREIADAFLN